MINLDDYNVAVGETKRMNCPVCKGVRTFSITNNMGSLLWNCYKASCDVSGGKRVHMTVDDLRATFAGGDDIVEEDFVIPNHVVHRSGGLHMNRWCARWGLDVDNLGLMYDVKEDRVVFPVKHNGVIVDATGRSLGKRLPKWKRYGKSGLPYTYGYGNVAVVVEDCVSAAIVGTSSSFVGGALLGTSLQETHKGYLTQFSRAVVALDPDALRKTLKMVRELRSHIKTVLPLKLKDDIKYMDPTDMEKLNGIITNT